jgi:hypothetical protein
MARLVRTYMNLVPNLIEIQYVLRQNVRSTSASRVGLGVHEPQPVTLCVCFSLEDRRTFLFAPRNYLSYVSSRTCNFPPNNVCLLPGKLMIL